MPSSGEPGKPPESVAEIKYIGDVENTCLYLICEYDLGINDYDIWENKVMRVKNFSLEDVKKAKMVMCQAIDSVFPGEFVGNRHEKFKKLVTGVTDARVRKTELRRIFDAMKIVQDEKQGVKFYFHHERVDRSLIINSSHAERAVEQATEKVKNLTDICEKLKENEINARVSALEQRTVNVPVVRPLPRPEFDDFISCNEDVICTSEVTEQVTRIPTRTAQGSSMPITFDAPLERRYGVTLSSGIKSLIKLPSSLAEATLITKLESWYLRPFGRGGLFLTIT